MIVVITKWNGLAWCLLAGVIFMDSKGVIAEQEILVQPSGNPTKKNGPRNSFNAFLH